MEPKYTLKDIAHLTGDPDAVAENVNDGKAILAVGCSAVWPGLGQLVAGKPRSAFAWCVSWIVIAAGILAPLFQPQWLPIEIVLLPLAVVFQLAQIAHAQYVGRHSSRPLFGDRPTRFTLGTLLMLAGIGEIYGAIAYLQNNYVEFCYSPTDSMAPAIIPGDIFLNFKQQSVGHWDIAAVNRPADADWQWPNLCKRIVGMPGDTVEITGPALLINQKPVQPPPSVGPYIADDNLGNPMADAEPLSAGNGCWGRPITLGPDEYFLLGDNSLGSFDSRHWLSAEGHQPGALPRDLIAGRIVGIVWPPQRWRVFENYDNH